MTSSRVALGFLLANSLAAQQDVISTIAGGAPPPMAALKASTGSPAGIAIDAGGSVYFTGLKQ